MQTSKPISTISYNSELYLYSVLEKLYKSHKIDFYAYIKHTGEMDPFGESEKDHIHLFLIPNKRINTSDLDDLFIEPVPNSKPLRCIPILELQIYLLGILDHVVCTESNRQILK